MVRYIQYNTIHSQSKCVDVLNAETEPEQHNWIPALHASHDALANLVARFQKHDMALKVKEQASFINGLIDHVSALHMQQYQVILNATLSLFAK